MCIRDRGYRELSQEFGVTLAGGDTTRSAAGITINVTAIGGGHSACCEIMDFHTNVTRVMRDENVLFQGGVTDGQAEETDRSVLSVEEIIRFADCLDVEDVAEVLERQIAYNSAISDEGLKGGWGTEVGRTLRAMYGCLLYTSRCV